MARDLLRGKAALVTGASSGIGRGIAEALAEAGADVAVAGRDAVRCREAAAAVEAKGRRGVAVTGDLRSVAETRALVDRAAGLLGRLDILVNCAGVFETRPIEEADEAFWDRVLETNLKGAYFAVQAAFPHFRRAGGGKVINVGSVAGEVGFPGATVYCASKAGLMGLTRAMALELAPEGINVNCVSPHNIVTPMNQHFFERNPEYREAQLRDSPAGRLGRVSDVTPAVVYLASEEADYVHGQTLFLDGGWLTK